MNNPLVGHFSIISLINKIVDLRKIILELSLDYLLLSKTKIDQNIPTRQFYIKGYKVRARSDRDKQGGLIEFVKVVLSLKTIKNMELSKVILFIQSLPNR